MWLGSSHTQYAATSEAEHSYLASAADLMIGLLFVFIIMVAFLALQKQVEQEKVTAEIESAKGKIGQLSRDPRGAVTRAIGVEVEKTLHSIQINEASGVITLPEELLFDLGSSELKSTAVERLSETSQKLALVLRCFVANQRLGLNCPQNPLGHEIDTIFIEGHTDSRPMNRDGGNTKLSLDRAISVSTALMQRSGLNEYKNDQGHPIFSYSAYADTRPLIKNDPADARNRRVDLRIVLTYRPSLNDKPIERVSKVVGN